MLRAIGRGLLLLLLFAASTESAEGQSGGALISVLAGVQGMDPEPHGFVGVGGGYLVRPRVGVEGVALFGAGGGYRSGLVAGGPSVVVFQAPQGQVRFWGGPAWYHESLAAPESAADPSRAGRATAAVLAGLTVRAPIRRIALTGGLLYWAGRLDEAGFESSETVHGFRLTLGIAR